MEESRVAKLVRDLDQYAALSRRSQGLLRSDKGKYVGELLINGALF